MTTSIANSTGPPITTQTDDDRNCSSGFDTTVSPSCGLPQLPGWYNATSCACQTLPVVGLELNHPAGVVFLTVAIVSTLLDILVVIVFVQFRHTPIVKAANRELSFLLLFVLMLCFGFPLIRMGTIAVWRCVVIIFEGPVTASVYAIFLVKTHRVLSIFEARLPKVVHRQWILGRSLQLVGVFVLTMAQVVISVVFVIVSEPALSYTVDPVSLVASADCKISGLNGLFNSAYPMLLTILSLCFAFRARRLPENYGESRHILATMAASFTVFAVCYGVSFVFDGIDRIIVQNIYVSFTPLAQLGLLFFPKVYIILACPERNTVQELRRMTLAHMQRQSEFSPTERAGRDGEGRRPTLAGEGRLRSLRSLTCKITNLSTRRDTTQAPGQTQSHDKSVSTKRFNSSQFENAVCRKDNNYEPNRSPRPGERSGANIQNKAASSSTRLHHKNQPRYNMRRQSSGLFVIQFTEETKERPDDGDDGEGGTAEALGRELPNFDIHETDSEGEVEGDMFVVSMLGRTLTLKVEDRKQGVPEILGGVYVGSTVVQLSKDASNKQTDQQGCKQGSDDGAKEDKDMGSGNCVSSNPKLKFGSNTELNQHPTCKTGTQMASGASDGSCEVKTVVDDTKRAECNDKNVSEEAVFEDTKKNNHIPKHKSATSNADTENSSKTHNIDGVTPTRHTNENCTCSHNVENNVDEASIDTCVDRTSIDNYVDKTSVTNFANEMSAGNCVERTNADNCVGKTSVENAFDKCTNEENSAQQAKLDTEPTKCRQVSSENEDAVSECSSSSNSTFCETAADDKRRLLRGNSRNQTEVLTNGKPSDETNHIDGADTSL